MKILVTGASGKLGRRVVRRLLNDQNFEGAQIVASTFSRPIGFEHERLLVVQGNLSDRFYVKKIMEGVTHVLHMASCKEMPELVMDVSVKGMFWLLEEYRSEEREQFILVGGDAAVGHAHFAQSSPITESHPHQAYPGCYALSKVLEEVMLTQSHIQYGTRGCCLRAPWLMADDDLRYALSFSDEVFGAPRWFELVASNEAEQFVREERVPLALDVEGKPLRRGMLAVDDLVEAIAIALKQKPDGCETYNIAMDEPFDYGEAAAHLASSFGLQSVEIQTDLHSVKLDNTKAKKSLGWNPKYSTKSLIDAAWRYERFEGTREKPVYVG